MKKRILIDVSESERLEEFLKTEDISIDLIHNGSGDVEVLRCDAGQEGGMNTLYQGGWIGCETAQALAGKLGISKLQIGRILNFLNIKIRHCSLGCFQ